MALTNGSTDDFRFDSVGVLDFRKIENEA